MNNLTPIQTWMMQFIRHYQKKHGYMPSVREIADDVNLASTSSAHYQLRQLEEKGFIRRGRGARTITLIQ